MKKLKWNFFAVFIIIFGIIAYFVINHQTGDFDSFVYNMVTFFKTDYLTGFYKFITFFASEVMILLVSLVLIIVFKNKKYGAFALLNAISILILNILLKLIFMRDRPYDLMIITESGYSFPSGHAMASLGFYGFIIYLLWHFNITKRMKILFSIMLSILILLIGMSRIYLGVHYASDVLAGYMVSGAYLILYITFIRKYLKFGDVDD